MEFLLLTFIRILVGLLILRLPLLGIITSIYIDGEDWHFFGISSSSEAQVYQVWDKTLDIFYLSIALFVSFFWKDRKAFLIGLFVYSLRTFGVILFLIFRNSIFLFIFSNLFENLFIFYLVYKKITGRDGLFTDRKCFLIILPAIFLPKIIQEYFFHGLGLSFGNAVMISGYLGLGGDIAQWVNRIVAFVLYLFLPVLALLWKRRRLRLGG